MFAWTRNFYASMNGICFQFESKRTRDKFVENGATKISAEKDYRFSERVKIEDRQVPIGGKAWQSTRKRA